jgi:hypothetical protein
MIKIIDNVLPQNTLEYIYTTITTDTIWSLSMASSFEADFRIAGRVLYEPKNNINVKCDSKTLAIVIFKIIQSKANFLTDRVKRIHLGAKAALQDDIKHKDCEDYENNTTVLFYLNTDWNKKWGGETIVGDKKIEYKPNRALKYLNLEHT